MPESLFADGIAEIAITSGVVRIEFFTLSMDRNSQAKPGETPRLQAARSVTVAMPLAGFVGSLKSFDDFKQRLIDGGMLKNMPDQANDSTASPNMVASKG